VKQQLFDSSRTISTLDGARIEQQEQFAYQRALGERWPFTPLTKDLKEDTDRDLLLLEITERRRA
jgi:hypothetical protein